MQHYEQEYAGSLLAVLSGPVCRPYVRFETVGGQQLALLLLDDLVGRSGAAASPAAPPAALLPLPIRLPQPPPPPPPQPAQQAQHAGGSSTAAAAAAGTNGTTATGAAATSTALPIAQLVTTAAAAEAAVAELLAAAEVAVDCEGDLDRDGAIALVQLYAGGERCYMFDLAGMKAGELPVAVGHLARLLESETTIKVCHGVVVGMAGLSAGHEWQHSALHHEASSMGGTLSLPSLLIGSLTRMAAPPALGSPTTAGHARLPLRLRGAVLPARHPPRRAVGHTGGLLLGVAIRICRWMRCTHSSGHVAACWPVKRLRLYISAAPQHPPHPPATHPTLRSAGGLWPAAVHAEPGRRV